MLWQAGSVAAPHQTWTVEQRLGPAQARRREAVRDLARALAASGGYNAVTTRPGGKYVIPEFQ